MSYGAIGMVVGHEVSHAFDDQGKTSSTESWLNLHLYEYGSLI